MESFYMANPIFVDDTKLEERKKALGGDCVLVKRSDALCYFGKPKGGMIKEIEVAKQNNIPVITPEQLKVIDKIVENPN